MTFKQYTVLLEKRKKKRKKKKVNKDRIPGIYGMPLYWNSYPVGGYVELDGGGVDVSN